jgi:hypothetical protein
MDLLEIDEEWASYVNANRNGNSDEINKPECCKLANDDSQLVLPKCDELYISTTTKVLYLNQEIDINTVFWKIPIIEYWKPESGVIKKQMKVVSHTKEEYNSYCKKLETLDYYNEHVIKSIDNPNARRNKFKDERKITVGMSKRDIMNCRGKVKNAFYNCFALILRFIYKGMFHEIHAKVFNTGKMEIPGILNDELLQSAKNMILTLLTPVLKKKLAFSENHVESNVLINSNFNCGFYINRDTLYAILRNKYNIETAFDPCSYPGVKCKFYYNNELPEKEQKGTINRDDRSQKLCELNDNVRYTEVSFMIFRTGSCLIVGNCTEKILRFVFGFIKNILQTEFANIRAPNEVVTQKVKQEKVRKKTITISTDVYNNMLKAIK